MIQVQWTCPSLDEARCVIRLLLEGRLIACANIIPEIESHYWWEGALEATREVKVYLKTAEHLFHSVEQMIRQNCSYQVPEIIAFKAWTVSKPYEEWVLKNSPVNEGDSSSI